MFHRLAVKALAGGRLAAEVEPRLAGLVRKELIRPHPATLTGGGLTGPAADVSRTLVMQSGGVAPMNPGMLSGISGTGNIAATMVMPTQTMQGGIPNFPTLHFANNMPTQQMPTMG